MGKTQKAVEYFEMALALDPSIDFARENLFKLTSINPDVSQKSY
jgi:hypothetical protein